MRILTVPGMGSDGRMSTDLAGAALRALGHEVLDMDQPIRRAWNVRWHLQADAADITAVATDGDVVLAHSYGCLKAAEANKTVRFAAMFLYRPAMSRNYTFPSHRTTRVYCMYSPQDWLILLGAMLRFNHPFGAAGRSGFTDLAVRNVRVHGGHSHDFTKDHVVEQALFVHNEIQTMGRTQESQ